MNKEMEDGGVTEEDLHRWHDAVEDCSTKIICAESMTDLEQARDVLNDLANDFSKYVNRRG